MSAVVPGAETIGAPAQLPVRPPLTIKDLKGKVEPDWCPGCGDFGVLNALKQAITELGLYPHEVMKTKSTPTGSVENPINPIPLAIAAGATYVARGYTGQIKHLVGLIKGGIMHKGFALIDAFSPCVTFNHDNTHDFFKQRTYKLEDRAHDVTDFHAAMERGYEWGEQLPIGLFWKRDDLPSLDQLEPVLAEGGALARRPIGVVPPE